MPRKRLPTQPQAPVAATAGTPAPGSMVQYYLEGWRTGYVEKVKGKVVRIRPIGPRHSAVPRLVTVALDDMKTI